MNWMSEAPRPRTRIGHTCPAAVEVRQAAAYRRIPSQLTSPVALLTEKVAPRNRSVTSCDGELSVASGTATSHSSPKSSTWACSNRNSAASKLPCRTHSRTRGRAAVRACSCASCARLSRVAWHPPRPAHASSPTTSYRFMLSALLHSSRAHRAGGFIYVKCGAVGHTARPIGAGY